MATIKQSNDVKTDYSRWRLRDERGAQTWHYLTEEQTSEWPQSTADKYHLGLPTVRIVLRFLSVHKLTVHRTSLSSRVQKHP